MIMNKRFTIGKLAAESKVTVETIRFYERKELITQPNKQGGIRYYPNEYATRIKFIKRAQELGFTLKEIKELLDLKIKEKAKCSDVLDKTHLKIDEINSKINDLKKMKKSLLLLSQCCDSSSIPLSDCPILECFMSKK